MLFDTDVIIDFLRGDVVAKKTLNSVPKNERMISSITAMELIIGARDKNEARQLRKFIVENFEIVHLTSEISKNSKRFNRRYLHMQRRGTGDQKSSPLSIHFRA